MALSLLVPIFGPPAAGKTTLTMQLGAAPGRQVFRLREHVARAVLEAATAASPEQLGWIDESTVSDALRAYFQTVSDDPAVHTVLLDNFPGSREQVEQLLATVWALTPCPIEAIEIVTDFKTLKQRARNRKVCHRCERDPINDPRLPAVPREGDPWQCARCGGLLHPRRGDSPRLFKARMQRYHQAAAAIRAGFAAADVTVTQLDTTNTIEGAANLLAPLLISRSAPL